MGRKYYCDFCEKAFADNPASKKNHFSGAHHQRLRKAHYDNFRDPASILSAELSKKPCRMFLQRGHCEFGNSCRYSHLTEENKRELEQQCQQNKQKGHTSSSAPVIVGELDEWLAKHMESKDSDGKSKSKRRKAVPAYHLPRHLASVPNLPPSLFPPTKEDFVKLPLLEWG